MSDPTITTSINVPLSLHQRAEAAQDRLSMNRSELYRTALKHYLDSQEAGE